MSGDERTLTWLSLGLIACVILVVVLIAGLGR